MDDFKKRYEAVRSLIDENSDQAYSAAQDLLNDFPDEPMALCAYGELLTRAERFGFGRIIYERAAEIIPKSPIPWNNIGMCWEGEGETEKAQEYFLKAHRLDPNSAGYLGNVAMTYLNQCKWKEALSWAKRAIEKDPTHFGAQTTYGFANLACGDWSEGWKGYEFQIGRKFRKAIQFQNEGRWQGEKGKTVVVYGEQGMGDEIMYSSCIPDMVKDCNVVLECDPRLEGLFKRSFEHLGVSVYGTRRIEPVEWPNKYKIDASCPSGHLPKFYRPTPESCPRTPYLVADPERRAMFRGWLDSLGKKPKIGITWAGGGRYTFASRRKIGLDAFKPLFDSVDAEWISLQYKPEDVRGTPVRINKWIEKNQDYDDAAAMVAELDLVVGVHSAAHHLAGALGVPTVTLVPDRHIWLYARDRFPWYDLTLHRQKTGESWKETIRRAIPLVRDKCSK